MAIGNIDTVIGGRVEGWLFADEPLTRPYVSIDGRPARILRMNTPRPDVERALGVKGGFGFVAELPGSYHGPARISLHAIDGKHVEQVHERRFDLCYNDGFSALDLAAAIEISREPDSVAIVVWDAAHNPVGRAKVLYDIATHSRPAVLFGFCHSEFGTRLWEPLQSSPIRCCLIRPEGFARFRDTARDYGLAFDTIWLCKPRLPTFQLAEAIARPGCAMVLDLDDNEEAFSRGSHSWDRAYGETSVNKAALYRDSIKVRSVASISLQERFGGEIVRHVRPQTANNAPPAPAPKPDAGGADLRLIFIGTVRPHKGMVEAARAIRMVAYRHRLKITLTVGGTFDPASLKEELVDAGVEILGLVPSANLQEILTQHDAVITGYPGHSRFDEVNTYQISSKIGDALQAGLPVLVPNSPATRDLADIPGIHLFDPATFEDVVCRVAQDRGPAPQLPDSFSIPKASETFEALVAQARASTPQGPSDRVANRAPRRNIVLLWKQNDSNLFGRRIDQIARLLAGHIEDASVYVVEFAEPRWLAGDSPGATSSEALCREETQHKLHGFTKHGVHHHTIVGQASRTSDDPPAGRNPAQPDLCQAFDAFLKDNGIYPTNSLVIAFPLHYIGGLIDNLLPILQPFKLIVDVVDNQLSWGTTKQRPSKIADYRAICDLAETVIFNSAINRDTMIEMSIAEAAKTRLIPNWYIAPTEDQTSQEFWQWGGNDRTNVLYSGDLNNRVDWPLLYAIVELVSASGGVLHLVGGSHRVQQEMAHLLNRPHCIYHGALREEAVLAIAAKCDFAVVPHLHDDLSTYMNPLKIKMYAAVGLPHIVTDVPGIDTASEFTTVARDHEDFLARIRAFFASPPRLRAPSPPARDLPPEAVKYWTVVEECLDTVTGPLPDDRHAIAARVPVDPRERFETVTMMSAAGAS